MEVRPMHRIGALLIFLGIIVLAACQYFSDLETKSNIEQPSQPPLDIESPTKTMSAQPIVTENIETIPPSRTLPAIEPDTSLHEVTNVPSGYIAGIRWPIEYEHAFLFAHNSIAPGKLQWWSYDLISEELQPVDQAIAIEKTSTDLNELPEGMDVSLLDSFELVDVSPSREKALLLEGIGLPTATPPPNPDGEISTEAYIANVWMWERDGMSQLGQIEMCGRNQYLWTVDEQLVAIQAPIFPSKCREANAWLADTVNKFIKPLLPFETYHGESTLIGFSPNEDRLLFKGWGPDDYRYLTPSILDIDTGSAFKVDIQANPLDWVNNDQVLVGFRNTPEEVLRPGIFDLQSNEIIELLTKEQMSSFEGKTIRWIELSPDKQWLVFTVDDEPYKASSLWVMAMDLE
jgi:hypothetical protein